MSSLSCRHEIYRHRMQAEWRPSIPLPEDPLPDTLEKELLELGDDSSFLSLANCLAALKAQQATHKPSEQQANIQDTIEDLLELSWEKLHHGNWKDVSPAWRQVYGWSAFLKAYCQLFLPSSSSQAATSTFTVAHCKSIMRTLDLALLMAGPACSVPRKAFEDLISFTQQKLKEEEEKNETSEAATNHTKKKARTRTNATDGATRSLKRTTTKGGPPALNSKCGIERVHVPSLERFYKDFMSKERPVIVTGLMDTWPALQDEQRRWSNLEYLKRVAGCRTVPVEIGSTYLEEDWSQRLMTFDQFVDDYVLQVPKEDGKEDEEGEEGGKIGYLAQTQLFEQIPELYGDIRLPDYCALSVSEEKMNGEEEEEEETERKLVIHCWFGPEGTVSPLHHDPYHNLLAQVVGRKYIRLYSVKESPKLYPHPSTMLFNTSQVAVEEPNLERFPLFAEAEYTECILEAGEMLYIPPKHWHYVRSLSISFSVSFWWE
ncbi:Lysine-specific demethylase 8 [Balamuthia mandrillaris]